jgi:hypothetical protein
LKFRKHREETKRFIPRDRLATEADERARSADMAADDEKDPGLVLQKLEGFFQENNKSGTAG